MHPLNFSNKYKENLWDNILLRDPICLELTKNRGWELLIQTENVVLYAFDTPGRSRHDVVVVLWYLCYFLDMCFVFLSMILISTQALFHSMDDALHGCSNPHLWWFRDITPGSKGSNHILQEKMTHLRNKTWYVHTSVKVTVYVCIYLYLSRQITATNPKRWLNQKKNTPPNPL